jgi:hypothetical protein
MRGLVFILFLLISGGLKGQTVFGKVTDENNIPLPFVAVTLKGENVGTTTDFDGEYKLDLVNDMDSVMFSFIGYDNIILVSEGGELNITMSYKTEVIDVAEVVTRVSRNNETILILDKKEGMEVESSVGSKELNKKGISNARDGLKKVGGVTFDNDRLNIPLFKMDEVGRNNSVHMSDESEYVIKRIDDYKVEEMIYDWQKECRITFFDLISTYLPKKTIKVVSKLHNKIVIQNDDDFKLFSLKNEEDSERLLQTLESYFISNSRTDSLFVRDESTINRKWMYNVLEKQGFNRKKLYRQKTTFSKRTYN